MEMFKNAGSIVIIIIRILAKINIVIVIIEIADQTFILAK